MIYNNLYMRNTCVLRALYSVDQEFFCRDLYIRITTLLFLAFLVKIPEHKQYYANCEW